MTNLRSEVESSLAEMTWLGPADNALKALALKLAEEIDSARARADEFGRLESRFSTDDDEFYRLRRLEAWCDVAKTVAMLGPRLREVLVLAGGAPGARKDFAPVDPDAGKSGRVHTLKLLRLGLDDAAG